MKVLAPPDNAGTRICTLARVRHFECSTFDVLSTRNAASVLEFPMMYAVHENMNSCTSLGIPIQMVVPE